MTNETKTKLGGIYIEINSHCNKKCIYCYNEDIIESFTVLPLSVVTKIIDEMKALGVNNISLSGGEPMLHPNILDILAYCHDTDIKVTMITNCSVINKENIRSLTESGPNLQLTIDSGIEDIHNMSRGKGTLQGQKSALNLLKENGYQGEINLRCNLWKKNLFEDSVKSVIEFAVEFGIKQVGFNLAHATENFHEILASSSEIEKADKMIEKLAAGYPDAQIKFNEATVSLGCPFIEDEKTVGCGFRIAPDGFVYPCQLFSDKEFRLGNVYLQTLKDILNGNELQRFLNLIQLRKHFIPACKSCVCQNFCAGGCPAMAYLENDNIFTFSGSCDRRKSLVKNELLKKAKELIP